MHFITGMPQVQTHAPMVHTGAPTVIPGAPMMQTGAPSVIPSVMTQQLGCGVVGIGCGQHAAPMAGSLAFGDDATLAGGWPMWAKVLLGVGALAAVGTVVYYVTR